VQARFLLGPSGTGKTFRCVAEVRRRLLNAPEGFPLLFLAPKQSTFQLERQLLEDAALPGYTRLRIISMEGLAEYVWRELHQAPPQLLTNEGRIMVLRALLAREREDLRLFRAAARLRGFAEQLSDSIRELQRAGVTPGQLQLLASKVPSAEQLDLKLQDLATLMQAYLEWLKTHRLRDLDQLLGLTTTALVERVASRSPDTLGLPLGLEPVPSEAPWFEELWFDGFSELAPQEIEFLAALMPYCGRATFTFNLDRQAIGPMSWLSTWSIPGQAFRRLQARLSELPGTHVTVEWLERSALLSRFEQNRVLAHLEAHWAEPEPHSADGALGPVEGSIRIVQCPSLEGEAVAAARAILAFVRAGGRYREAAVVVRNLDNYFDPVRRVFNRYGIPFFIDRREPVGRHPLSELTRSAWRTLAFGWQPNDWFSALKTGLVHPDDTAIDRLENEALARGWSGNAWVQPVRIPDSPGLEQWCETLRQKLVPPFEELGRTLGNYPSGAAIAEALITFWEGLGVAQTLETWTVREVNPGFGGAPGSVHGTLWRQMQEWLENLALAFAHERLSLREWLPILEAGLASQTVGVIPPTLDQVVVGAIDRSRTPDVKFVMILGLNETVFPTAPRETRLLTSADREQLQSHGVTLGATTRHQLSTERYLGYVAMTRAKEQLLITYAERDEDDKMLNASPFVTQLRQLFPTLVIEMGPGGTIPWETTEHICELLGTSLQTEGGLPASLQRLGDVAQVQARVHQFHSVLEAQQCSPALCEHLYGKTLETSVSRLEEYAACPFRFAVTSGLRVEERKAFRLDVRHQGSFQHEVLARFHRQLSAENRRWRDLTVPQAQERLANIATALMPEYESGLLRANEQTRFTAQSLVRSLQEFIAAIIDWMPQYEFEPHAVELAFGIEEKPLPAWEVDLDDNHRLSFRGKIDRIDLAPQADGQSALCVVLDYKSSARSLDPVLMAHGVQLQLLAYLNVLRDLAQPRSVFGVGQLIPAGVFFVNLRGQYASAKSRSEALTGAKTARAQAYQHTGRFDIGALRKLDSRPGAISGDQFKYRLRHDGKVHSGCREVLQSEQLDELIGSVQAHLTGMGREIYVGNIAVDPYRKGNDTACDKCGYQAVCRIDPWTHLFRVLKGAPEPGGSNG
jgi:ATP-dependent helicase/nuclease subunit B